MTTRRRAAESAADQLRRLLHLIPELADGEAHGLEEVAGRAGVPASRLLADLNALVERYDVPAGWVDGVSILVDRNRVSVRADHFRRPMRLTMSEVCALELGLMILRQESPAERHATIDGALARLREAITRLPANDQQEDLRAATVAATGSPEVLATVREAVRGSRKLRIRYRAGGAEEATERTVCPYGLTLASGAWYAVAHCERSEGLRFFRVDRIEEAALLGEDFTPGDVDVEALVAGGKAFAGPAEVMTVRYSPRIARWIAEREGKDLAEDGSLTLEHPLADQDWAMRHVLQYGADAEVVGPDSLRRRVRERLSEMAGFHEAQPAVHG